MHCRCNQSQPLTWSFEDSNLGLQNGGQALSQPRSSSSTQLCHCLHFSITLHKLCSPMLPVLSQAKPNLEYLPPFVPPQGSELSLQFNPTRSAIRFRKSLPCCAQWRLMHWRSPPNHSPSHERLALFGEKMFHYYLFILHIINPAAVKLKLPPSMRINLCLL